MLLAKKCQYFRYLNLIKISLEIIKKETFLSIRKKKDFPNSKKSHFSKGVYKQKMPISSLFRFIFFDLKKAFFKVQKMAFFSKGLTHAFGQKMPIFSLFKFDQNKPRNNAF